MGSWEGCGKYCDGLTPYYVQAAWGPPYAPQGVEIVKMNGLKVCRMIRDNNAVKRIDIIAT